MSTICKNSNGHKWTLVRRSIVDEVHPVTLLDSNGDEMKPGDVALASKNGTTMTPVVLAETRDTEYVRLMDEWLECAFCSAEVRGDVIGEIDWE